jgi:hypothetical protein
MSKTYYTEKAWHRAAVEDARNPSFTIMEIEFKAGDTLVIGDEEYSDVEEVLNECPYYYDGDIYQGNPKDVLECVTIYKIVD